MKHKNKEKLTNLDDTHNLKEIKHWFIEKKRTRFRNGKRNQREQSNKQILVYILNTSNHNLFHLI